MTRRAPRTLCTVRRIRSSRSWVMTMGVTSAGIRPSSISCRTMSKSVCEADGKPTSISLKPMRTSSSNRRSLRSRFMGSNKAWLPSRRSVDSHTGACASVRDGHCRSGRATGGKGRYLVCGWASMDDLAGVGGPDSPAGRRRGEVGVLGNQEGCGAPRAPGPRPWVRDSGADSSGGRRMAGRMAGQMALDLPILGTGPVAFSIK